jgi:carnitine-CoA ligase
VEDSALSPSALWEWCEQRLPSFAVPRYLRFVEALPKTPSEKGRKVELRQAGVTEGTHDREAARG